jgi:hypothetical protein
MGLDCSYQALPDLWAPLARAIREPLFGEAFLGRGGGQAQGGITPQGDEGSPVMGMGP